MKQTKEMSDAWEQLQQLTSEDPFAISAMSRYLAALGMMVAGKRGRELEVPEPQLQSGFIMTTDQRDILMAAAVRIGRDVVHLAFHHDDADKPQGIVVIRAEDEKVVCYSRNALWSPPGSKRAVIVNLNQGPRCHFALRPGGKLERIEGWPAADIDAGVRRAAGRLNRLAASEELRDAPAGAYRHVVQFNRPGDWTVGTVRIAA